MKQAKRKAAFDCDDVLVKYFEAFLAFCNEAYGENFRPQDFTSCRYDQVWGITLEQLGERRRAFNATAAAQNLEPVEGAQEGVNQLAKLYELEIITSRARRNQARTERMIERLFPGKFAAIHCCGTGEGRGQQFCRKSEVCEVIGAQWLVDDHPDHVEDCSSQGITVVMFTKAWNQEVNVPSDLVLRASSWKEIVEELTKE